MLIVNDFIVCLAKSSLEGCVSRSENIYYLLVFIDGLLKLIDFMLISLITPLKGFQLCFMNRFGFLELVIFTSDLMFRMIQLISLDSISSSKYFVLIFDC